MANIRNLKKDINYLSNELVIECLTYEFLFPGKNGTALSSIINDTIELQKNTLGQINLTRKVDKKSKKAAIKAINTEYQKQTNEIISRFSALNTK